MQAPDRDRFAVRPRIALLFSCDSGEHPPLIAHLAWLAFQVSFATIAAMPLLPRFSLRTLLIVTAVCSVMSLILAQAVRGNVALGVGFLFALLSFATSFGIFATLSGLALAVARCFGPTAPAVETPPFAVADAMPPASETRRPVA